MIKEVFISFLPIYQLKYGKINKFNWYGNKLKFEIIPATKFGVLLKGINYYIEFIFNKDGYNLIIKK